MAKLFFKDFFVLFDQLICVFRLYSRYVIFPNNFKELEELGKGGFYIVDEGTLEYVPLGKYQLIKIFMDCKGKSSEQVRTDLMSMIEQEDFNEKVVLIRLRGTLSSGKQADINFRDMFNIMYEKGAYFIMKNTTALNSTDLDEWDLAINTVKDWGKELAQTLKEKTPNVDMNVKVSGHCCYKST